MKVFVSYSRRDNDSESLSKIKQQTSFLGEPYIDDLYNHSYNDREQNVERALREAEIFVLVVTPGYLTTAWTRKEFTFALDSGVPVLALKEDGTFIDQLSAEWPWLEVNLPSGCRT